MSAAPTYTVSTETDESYTEEEVDPQLLINGWESTLQEQSLRFSSTPCKALMSAAAASQHLDSAAGNGFSLLVVVRA